MFMSIDFWPCFKREHGQNQLKSSQLCLVNLVRRGFLCDLTVTMSCHCDIWSFPGHTRFHKDIQNCTPWPTDQSVALLQSR